jgi:DnaK suppressor protein
MQASQVEKYKQRLVKMREQLTEEVNRMIGGMQDEVNRPGDISTVPTHNADRDVEGLDRELALIHNEEGLLEEVEAALQRVEAGTFGKCTNCGGPISAARLEALPHAPMCIDCAQREEQERGAPHPR